MNIASRWQGGARGLIWPVSLALAAGLGWSAVEDPRVAIGAATIAAAASLLIWLHKQTLASDRTWPDIRVIVLASGFAAWAFISDSFLVEPSVAGSGALAPAPAKIAPYLLMLGGSLALVSEYAVDLKEVRKRGTVRIATVYVGAVFISALLSPIGPISVIRWAQFTIPVLAAAVLASRMRMAPFALACAAALLHVAIGTVSPQRLEFGPEVRITGYLQVNTYAFAACILILVAAHLLGRRGGARIAGIALIIPSVAALIGARSRTALIACMVGIAVILVVPSRRGGPIARRLWYLWCLGLTILVGWVSGLGSYFETYFTRGGADELGTLTGRTELWNTLLGMIAQRPFLGYGPASLRTGEYADQVIGAVGYGGQAHNALLSVAFESGVYAAAIWAALLATTIHGAFASRSTVRPLWAGVAVCIAVSSLTEAGPSGFGLFWAVTLGVIFAAGQRGSPGLNVMSHGAPGSEIDQSMIVKSTLTAPVRRDIDRSSDDNPLGAIDRHATLPEGRCRSVQRGAGEAGRWQIAVQEGVQR